MTSMFSWPTSKLSTRSLVSLLSLVLIASCDQAANDASSPSAASTGWLYSDESDPIHGAQIHTACVKSADLVQTTAGDDEEVTLCIRNSPERPFASWIDVSKGSFLCGSGCIVAIRLDQSPPDQLIASLPEDAEDQLELSGVDEILHALPATRTFYVELPFTSHGKQIVGFPVSGLDLDRLNLRQLAIDHTPAAAPPEAETSNDAPPPPPPPVANEAASNDTDQSTNDAPP